MTINKISTDWLASVPVFYNEKTGRISENVNDVIDWRNVEFDPEGFNNYLDFGYSVFGQTPVKNVKFLEPNSEIEYVNKKVKIVVHDDPVEKLINKEVREDDVVDMIQSKVREWEKGTKGEIVIPTSGGLDSRLLNIFIKDKSRIKSFTYGVSDNQSESFEVVYARELSRRLGTKWQQIELGEYHRYFDEWNALYGISTHAHGMYHFEFYNKVKKYIGHSCNLLSGIIGDGWSGNVVIDSVNSISEVDLLGYSHAMHSDSKYSFLIGRSGLKEKYFEVNRKKLNDYRWRIIESMRIKMILLSYLIKLPKMLGFNTCAPFLDVELACAMLNLSEDRRVGRKWQKDYLKKIGCDFENMGLKMDMENTLNYQAMKKVKLVPLNVELLREVVNKKYIENINKIISVTSFFSVLGVVQKLFDRINMPFNVYNSNSVILKAYCAYLTLKPIENLIIRRNQS